VTMPYVDTVPPAGDEKYYDELGNEMDKKYPRGLYDEYRGGDGNINGGSNKFLNWLLAILTSLITIGIVGGVNMYGQIQAINSKVDLIIQGRIK
jgi:hypothetical protein